jgi:hypothetical protein
MLPPDTVLKAVLESLWAIRSGGSEFEATGVGTGLIRAERFAVLPAEAWEFTFTVQVTESN